MFRLICQRHESVIPLDGECPECEAFRWSETPAVIRFESGPPASQEQIDQLVEWTGFDPGRVEKFVREGEARLASGSAPADDHKNEQK